MLWDSNLTSCQSLQGGYLGDVGMEVKVQFWCREELAEAYIIDNKQQVFLS